MNSIKRISLLSVLYITQGISPGFTLIALPVLLRNMGLSIEFIGIAGLLSWPWSVKFLWGPLIDKKFNINFGRRKSWIIPLQIAISICLLLVGLLYFDKQTKIILIIISFTNLISSILDVATDAFATELLLENERGKGNSAQIGGFYIGSAIGGGLFLMFYDDIGWLVSFVILAAFVIFGISFLLFVKEHKVDLKQINTKSNFKSFFIRKESCYVLLLIILLDFGNNFGVSLNGPFFVDLGVPQTEIGWLIGTVGTFAALFGAILGGIFIDKVERSKALLRISLIQILPLFFYFYLALSSTDSKTLIAIIVFTQFFVESIFNVALYSWIMDKVSFSQTATDFSIMACVHNLTLLIASPFAGYSIGNVGYKAHFIFAVVLSIIGVFAANKILKKKKLLQL